MIFYFNPKRGWFHFSFGRVPVACQHYYVTLKLFGLGVTYIH